MYSHVGLNQNAQKKTYSQPYTFFKADYHPIFPLTIYQTWHTKRLPPKMRERVELLKRQNPRFEHRLFDDADCRAFIRDHFRPDVLDAYDALIPGAYKADLWRCCVLYIHGGIYLDIKFACVNGFRLIELTEQNHFVLDRMPPLSIYNAVMACQKGHPLLWLAIRKIVENVADRFYGSSPLEPTGPLMLGKLILQHKMNVNLDMVHYKGGGFILSKNRFVLSTEYPEYNAERGSTYQRLSTKRYDALWTEKNIYK